MTPPPNSTNAPVPAILVAAGRSRRVGGPKPKLWIELVGEPVLLHSLRALRRAKSVGTIVVVAQESDHGAIQALVQGHGLGPATCTTGGDERADSVRQGLLAMEEDAGLVLVHDAARPLVLPSDIDRLVELARASGSALLASPVRDSLHRAEDDRAQEAVPRKNLWAAETPQIMDRDLLLGLLDRAQEQGLSPTDEATLHEMFVGPIPLMRSSAPNPKFTWASDLALFQAILQARQTEPTT